MTAYRIWLAAALAWSLALSANNAMAATGKTLRPFADEAEFTQLLADWKARAQEERQRLAQAASIQKPSPAPPTVAAAEPGESTVLDRIEVTGSRITAANMTSITNVQTVGVDEGDIVKKSGDYLIVLRRGKIFTIRIGSDDLKPVASINAYAPEANPDNTWYDEMLVSDGTVVVIGYSYERGGTEIGLFDLSSTGQLRHRATYQMRSNDYYSARNYASRLLGRKLIFYTPLVIDTYDPDPNDFYPALRHWHRDSTPQDFKRILPATRIYRAPTDIDLEEDVALHTVSVCDLDAPTLQCESTAVLGATGRVFYVSEDAVYVWTAPWSPSPSNPNASSVFRIPLNAAAPTGLRTSGSPIDQMSFLQRDGYLNVVVGSEADGEGMWASNSQAGDLALLRLPLDSFGDGSAAANPADYHPVPALDDDLWDVQNRFVGDWLIYGAGNPWSRKPKRMAHALLFAKLGPVQTIHLSHQVERIDALGRDAILVGSVDSDLHFTSIRLGQSAIPVSSYVQRNAAQGDDRTHGFFYKPQGDQDGIAGLPILRFGPEGDSAAAGVLYLRNLALRLRRMGTLDSLPHFNSDDGCEVSCVDWYGNARPIFIGDRVFALLGYELVEGRVVGDRIMERRRAYFAPIRDH